MDVVREIIEQSESGEYHPYTIATKLDTPFDYRIIKKIIEYFKSEYPFSF
ncbi:MAG: hypothetical protein ACFE8C_14665 [Promethearchaeota archaeon]